MSTVTRLYEPIRHDGWRGLHERPELAFVNSRLVRAALPEGLSPGDSRTTTQGLVIENGLLLRGSIVVQLPPPLSREVDLADGLCFGDIGQEFLLECVSHKRSVSHVND
jgi:hypothetical protein